MVLGRSSFALCFLVLCALATQSQADDAEVISIQLRGYNYEISKRTADIVNIFLDNAVPPINQMVVSYNNGLVSRDNLVELRRLLWLQIKAAPSVFAISVSFTDGLILGYTQDLQLLDNSNDTVCSAGDVPLTPNSRCLRLFTTNRYGDPVNFASSLMYDVTMVPRFQLTLERGFTWAEVQAIDLMEPGVIYSGALRNSSSSPVGMATATLMYTSLVDFLYDNFNNADDDRVVFIVTSSLDMVAASVKNVSYVESFEYGYARPRPIKVYNCSDSRIRTAGEFLRSLANLNGTDNMLYVYNELYIQIDEITRTGIDWFVIVVRPISPSQDFISTSSTTFFGACVVCSVSFIMSVLLIVWVVRYRKMKLWSYAQPRVLILLLMSNILCVAFGYVLVLPPSDNACAARAFVGTIAVTCASAVILGKALYMFHLDSPLVSKTNTLLLKSLIFVWGCVLLQLVLLIAQAAIGTNTMNEYYAQGGGELVLKRECVTNNNGFMKAEAAIILLLSAGGCYFAYRTRSASKSYAESRGLLAVALQATGLSVGYVCVELLFLVSQGVVTSLLEVMAVVWFVAITQAILFVPRMFRQLTAGDLTLAELREMIQKHSTATKMRMTNNVCPVPVQKDEAWAKYTSGV